MFQKFSKIRRSAIHSGFLSTCLIFAMSTASHAQDHKSECSAEDLKTIEAFDKKAAKNMEKLQEYENAEDHTNERQYMRELKELDKLWSIFRGDEFDEMEKVYVRCDKKAPRPKTAGTQFWMPDRMLPDDHVSEEQLEEQ